MKKILKVLNIISNMEDGGAQKIVLNYLNDFVGDQDIQVETLLLNDKYNEKNKKEIMSNNLTINSLKTLQEKKNIVGKIFNYFQIKNELTKFIRTNKPDIVHIHLFGSLLYSHNVINKCNVPLRFYTLHSDPSRFKGIKLKILRNCFKKEMFIPVCVTESQANFAKKYYKFDRYEVVHNGVDFNDIKKKIINKEKARKKFNININDFVVCAVGRLDPIKQFDFLIECFNNILKKNCNSKLIIAGDGNEKNNLLSLVKRLGIEKNVNFCGNITNVVELYCASDVLVVTSKSESSSLVLLEAQACGIKCVISDGVPSESIITDKVIKMKSNSVIDEWSNSILYGGNYEKKQFGFSDYELHRMSDKMKKIYIEYFEEYQKK